MKKIASIRAASELIKIASNRLLEQELEITTLRAQIEEYQQMNKAAELASRMADSGYIDYSDIEAQANSIYDQPQRMEAVEEAINMLGSGSFNIANLSDEHGQITTSARSKLESFLFGEE
jgi:hypothetical protein